MFKHTDTPNSTKGMVKIFSPAKINLFLNVLRKRKDGYHGIETLFERLDLGDTVVLKAAPAGVHLRSYGEKIPSGRTNLAVRAAALIKKTYRVRGGAHVFIQKRIPVSAGLGGGSSNAAAVLLGLNRLWQLHLTRRKLMELGAKLGSDAPFFILDTPFSLGRGTGGVLEKISAPGRKIWHVLVKPPFGISTKEAYEHFDRSGGMGLTLPKADVRMLVRSIQKGDSDCLAKLLSNSLEVTLNKRVTIILEIKKRLLKEGALGALLSGSGSCVFGIFPTEQKALRAARRLRQLRRAWKVFVASTY